MDFRTAFKWSAINNAGVMVLQIIIGIILARLLKPGDFGLLAMVTVFTSFMKLFVDSGLGAYIIYKDNLDNKDLSTAFWINVLGGGLLSLLLFINGNLIANFYNEPILYGVVALLSFNFIINSFTIVQRAIFERQRDFKVITGSKVVGVITSAILAICLAILDYGVWSLVFQMLALNLVISFYLWFKSNWKPSFIISVSRAKQMYKYGLPLLGSNLFGYSLRKMDTIIVGKFLGESSLGIYSKSFQYASLPSNQITGIIGGVMFPSFSRLKQDTERVWRYLKDIYLTATFISVYTAINIYFLSESFVLNVLGPQWGEMISILQLFSLVTILIPLERLLGTLFYSFNKTRIEFKINLFTGALFALVVIPSLFGIEYVVMHVCSVYLISFIIRGILGLRIIDKSLRDLLPSIVKPVFSGVIIFGFLLPLEKLVYSESFYMLLLGPFLILLLYTLLSYLLFKNDVTGIYNRIKDKLFVS